MGCPPRVRSALKKVDGVQSVDVDYLSATATVKVDASCSNKSLLEALDGVGFEGKIK
ncbi:MAG TPA: heavy-metal-associated domain-containing protein [Planctomycetes bacterium]|nr:heavy-metal-associated domain-containing protein [Planctomycetota bacterium]HIK61540.1 heavy-metal-associated domain-containing protein [Planctomycetota bacterium]